jgi:signal transduction histidine kinase
MVSIEDNGKGMHGKISLQRFLKEGHFGLVGIDERVALLGGRLRFQNKSDGGLLIQAEIPHSRK